MIRGLAHWLFLLSFSIPYYTLRQPYRSARYVISSIFRRRWSCKTDDESCMRSTNIAWMLIFEVQMLKCSEWVSKACMSIYAAPLRYRCPFAKYQKFCQGISAPVIMCQLSPNFVCQQCTSAYANSFIIIQVEERPDCWHPVDTMALLVTIVSLAIASGHSDFPNTAHIEMEVTC